jgi:DNA-binding NarL/FixJ family response regulator
MKRVLLIDDDKSFRTLLKRLLERKFDSKVFEANDGAGGLISLEKDKPHIVFLDIDMPNMNGLQFLEKIQNRTRPVAIVVMTNRDEKEYVEKIIQMGVDDYLLKTKFVTQLYERIEILLKKIKQTTRAF